jgi:signal transduction histidine kinase
VEDLIQELRYLSAGMEEPFSPYNLSGLVYQAYDGIARSAESKGIRAKITVPKELMLPVQKNRMERVFTNLMNNSLEAVPEGGLLAIEAINETNNVLLRIDDNGPGVPEAILPNLFLPFVVCIT